jgi:hypothetical protein
MTDQQLDRAASSVSAGPDNPCSNLLHREILLSDEVTSL